MLRLLGQLGGSAAADGIAARLAPRSEPAPPRLRVDRRPDWQRVADWWSGRGGAGKAQLADAQTLADLPAYGANIENMIGTVKLPVGIAGPLRVNGVHARGDFHIPLATTEAALVASYARGADLITRAAHAGVRGPVVHVCIDMPRAAVPISGTRLRGDAGLHRRFLSEPVRASFAERVAILGGESSGKTTLARALAVRLETNWVPEYGRELWNARAGALRYADMLDIATVQVEREARAAHSANRWLICDTTPLTTASFSSEMFGKVDVRLRSLAERRYDRSFICAPDIDFVQDGTRRDEAFRVRQHDWYVRELTARGIGFVVLAGSLADRVGRAASALEAASRPDASA